VRNILSGAAAAFAIAFTFAVPRVYGIESWKIVLGIIGIGLFVLAGRIAR